MLSRNISESQLQEAAKLAGVGIVELRKAGPGYRFRLEPLGEKIGGSKQYQLVRDNSFGGKGFGARKDGRRNVHAICWHGFREFFRAAFIVEPGARFQTGRTRLNVPGGWYTSSNFEKDHAATDVNIGSQMYPLTYSEACDCGMRVKGA